MIGTSNQSVPEMAIEPGFLGPAGRALWVLRTDEPRKLTQSSEEKRTDGWSVGSCETSKEHLFGATGLAECSGFWIIMDIYIYGMLLFVFIFLSRINATFLSSNTKACQWDPAAQGT
jgi:hypothetical protein